MEGGQANHLTPPMFVYVRLFLQFFTVKRRFAIKPTAP